MLFYCSILKHPFLILKICRISIRKTERVQTTLDIMPMAVREWKYHNKSIRGTAKAFKINYQTVARYCSKFSNDEVMAQDNQPIHTVGYIKNRVVFTAEQEKEFVDYGLMASGMYFGLSPMEIRRLEYTFAIHSQKHICKSWVENTMARAGWFMKTNQVLSGPLKLQV